jgi:recombination protein RecT
MENNNINEISKEYDLFRSNLGKYEKAVADLLGNKYGITPQEFIVKVSNAVKKTPELLKCSSQSLFGSILYFAEIGLPFNTPEGFGYITTDFINGSIEAVPIIGYRGLIEIAYRNPRVKSIRIQAVYEGDEFDYEYGTQEYIRHKPNIKPLSNRKLVAVYAIVKLDTIDPLFVVVHKAQLDELKKISKSANSVYGKADIFNVMESKVAIKLLFKTLPKTDNEALIKALDMDNRFDYDKNIKISVNENCYQVLEDDLKTSALKAGNVQPISFVENIESKIEVSKYEEKIETKIQPETDENILGINIHQTSTPIKSVIDDWTTSSKIPLKVTTDNEVEKIEVSESDEHKKETEKELNDIEKETIIEWDLDIVEKTIFENKNEKIETTSRSHPEFLKQLKPIEIPEIQTPKTEQKLTPKTEKELLEGIIEVIEIIDLTNR